ncbi:MAG TPA: PfkB family carbohydrate kinase [Chitinophagaceae bacterium]|nr:PfkB family carbohydrate kinase [Chitinophagaceae bacterium]
MIDFQQLFSSFADLKVGVIGDVMLDTYIWGKVDRISPEAPVPVVTLQKKEFRIGGAGNVALNCAALQAGVTILSVLGDDEEGQKLISLLNASGIDTAYLISSVDRVTTSKTRVISRNQQMMRLDAEVTDDLNEQLEDQLLEKIKLYISNESPDVIIFEDYNKGVLTETLVKNVLKVCREENIITAVDPKRKNFFSYNGVTIFKPNLKEVKDGLNLLIDEINDVKLSKIHAELSRILQHEISFITLSEKGVFFQQGKGFGIIPSHVRQVADVSGAGDTVIAVASLVYAATKNTRLMAEMANIAGGLVCEEVGTVAIDREKFEKECKLLLG